MHNITTRHRLLTRITPPATEPLALNDTRDYLRISHTLEDAMVSDMIVTARMTAENWLRRSLITQTWKLGYDDRLPASVSLPMGPVNTIGGVTIVHRDNSTETVDAGMYHMNSAKNQLLLDRVVTGFHVEIIYHAGYGDTPTSVPAPIRQGMLCHIASMYENRGENSIPQGLPDQAISLYLPFREALL